MSPHSVEPQYFVDLYRRERDPWNFETSEYDRAKYEHSLGVLRWWYESALELGCSIGVFTARLAPRCRRLSALDVSPDALHEAQRRCSHLAQVRCVEGRLPRDYPKGAYDLVTLCEIGYYLDGRDLDQLKERMIESLIPRGQILLVHWTPPVEGHAQSAQEVHAAFGRDPRLRQLRHDERETYLLDLFVGTNSEEHYRSMGG